MKIEDFRYMYRGKPVRAATEADCTLLQPFEKTGSGNKRALLLLHGFSSSPAVFRLMIPELEMYDSVVCPKLTGHGESIADFAKTSAQEWIASAEGACTKLIDNYEQVDVLGLSLGGIIACHLSQKFNLNHLYLLAPALSIKTHITFTLNFARVMRALGFKMVRNRAGNILRNGQSELTYRQLPVTAVIEILTLIRDFEFKQPSCATDLFLGRFDEVVDNDRVAESFSEFSNVSTHWLENSAHILSLDNEVDTILQLIKQQA